MKLFKVLLDKLKILMGHSESKEQKTQSYSESQPPIKAKAVGVSALKSSDLKCCAPLDVPLGRGKDRELGDFCNKKAIYFIKGSPYCTRHAQINLLKEVMSE